MVRCVAKSRFGKGWLNVGLSGGLDRWQLRGLRDFGLICFANLNGN